MSVTIIVLGMHRSGTSALMGLLESTGIYIGPTNPAVREPGSLVSIDNEILEISGGAWDAPPGAPLSWNDRQEKRARRFLRSFDGQVSWGMKDPRLLLTLDFWYPRLLPEARLLATFRNPVAVAASLNRRNPKRWTISAGLELYTEYNRRLLRHSDAHGFPIINFDLEANAYLASVELAFRAIGYRPAREQDYFDPAERHHTQVDLSRADTESREVYEELCRRAIKPPETDRT